MDTIVPDYLADFYTQPASDVRFILRGAYIYASDIPIDPSSLVNTHGWTVQEELESIDAMLGTISGSGTGTVNNYYTTNAPTTNAADIRVVFAPSQYDPLASNVEAHLVAIDSRLEYLFRLYTSAVPATNVTLVSVAVTGPATVEENSSGTYTSTATFSDAATLDIGDTAEIWTYAGGYGVMTSRVLTVGAITNANTNGTISALWSFNGATRSGSLIVSLVNTNAPTNTGFVVYCLSLSESSCGAAFKSYILDSDGNSNDMTAASVFTVLTGVATNTGGVLCAGETLNDEPGTLHGIFNDGVDLWTYVTNDMDSNSQFRSILKVSPGSSYGTPSTGATLTVYAWDNTLCNGWPVSQYSTGLSSSIGATITLVHAQAYTALWYRVIYDFDGDGILSAGLASSYYLPTEKQCMTEYPAAGTLYRGDRDGWSDISFAASAASNPVVTIVASNRMGQAGWTQSDVNNLPQSKASLYDEQLYACTAESFWSIWYRYRGQINISNRCWVTKRDWDLAGISWTYVFETYGVKVIGATSSGGSLGYTIKGGGVWE